MFDNIGEKIKGLAKTVCWLGIISSCALGIYFFVEEEDFLLALVAAVSGSLVSWVSCLTLYGFGELISKVVSIEKHVVPAAPAAPAQYRAPAQPQTYAQPQVSAQAQANLDRINNLKNLLAQGLITEEEYQKALRGN